MIVILSFIHKVPMANGIFHVSRRTWSKSLGAEVDEFGICFSSFAMILFPFIHKTNL